MRAQNRQVAAGQLGAEPAPDDSQFQLLLNIRGRLTPLEEFRDIVLYVGLTAVSGHLFNIVPGGFILQQDKQYLVAVAQLPDASSESSLNEARKHPALMGLYSSYRVQVPGDGELIERWE
ncbi:hypothetical protein [Marinobacter piscensis]|uniref:hypothetical protein n=1 Tax=Marinobacter piscensis TaxID=1562308 RepID=UPI0011A0DDE9